MLKLKYFGTRVPDIFSPFLVCVCVCGGGGGGGVITCQTRFLGYRSNGRANPM